MAWRGESEDVPVHPGSKGTTRREGERASSGGTGRMEEKPWRRPGRR